MRRYLLGFLLGIVLMGLSTGSLAQIKGLRVESGAGGAEVLSFQSQTPITPKKSFVLENPNRVVVDMPAMAASSVSLPTTYTSGLVKSIRIARFDTTTTRLVIDVAQAVRIVNVRGGDSLAVEIAPVGAMSAVVALPKKELPLIIIDAGHGGQDPGALGKHGTHEKEVTLNYARALRDALIKTGRYRAELTRDDDIFIKLADRVAIARKQKGDLFISLHADSNPKAEARGFSVYTVSETASDDEAAALAEQENKADIIDGIDLNTADPDVASILIDLTQRETMNKSAKFADAIVASAHPRLTKLAKTHRFAGFRVLKSPDIPSVLIELGFLTNAADEHALLTPEHRERVIASIIKGIDRYRAAE